MAKTSAWLSVTPSLLDGVKIINGVDEQKFPLILNRIAQFLQSATDDGRPFTQDEEDKLQSTLSGIEDKESLQTLLDTSTLILSQAAYHVAKPPVLQKDLVDAATMTEGKAQVFTNVWSNNAKAIVNKLRQKTIHPVQLEGVSWMMNVSAASSSEGVICEPRAILELKLKEEDRANASNVILDMDRTGLHRLYNALETIQSQLDNLR